MSDDEDYEYEYDDDASDVPMEEGDGGSQDYDDDEGSGFEYTDDEEEADDVHVALENAYYNAKGLRENPDDLSEAVEALEGVVTMERDALRAELRDGEDGDDPSGGPFGPWSYKAIKQLVKLHLQTAEYGLALTQYERLLRCAASGAVMPNAVEKGVNGMLERVSSLYSGGSSSAPAAAAEAGVGEESASDPKAMARSVYDVTLWVFHPRTGASPNERLWFKTNLKFGQLLYEMNETVKLQLVIRDLLRGSQDSGGSSVPEGTTSGSAVGSTNLMEIYALQIQLYSRQKDNKKLREIFDRAMRVRGGIPHPRTLALIQELGGKMHMASREFEPAGKTFFQAFKSYDEAGDPSRLRCLKYLVMASMLHASTINPFDSQEARPYRDDPEIVAMTNLVQAFHNNEIRKFESILRKNEGRIMDDEFVREHLADLLRTIRTQVLQKVIGPYTRISLTAVARELNGIPVEDVESLLVGLILDGKLDGRIDQVGGVLLKSADGPGSGGGGSTNPSSSATAAAGASVGVSVPSSSSGSAARSGAAGNDTASAVGGGGVEGVRGGPLDDGEFNGGSTSSWGESSAEARGTAALDRLAGALEQLTAAVTCAGAVREGGVGGGVGMGRAYHHQVL